MATHNVEIPEVLRCLLSKDMVTGRWLGHCLDFDIVTSGEDEEKAWKNLKAVVRAHVESCFTQWQDGLKFRATRNEIDLFEKLKERQQNFRSDKLELKLTPPPEVKPLPLWIQGIEWIEGAARGETKTSTLQAVN
jgi:predicted RNase H-like HicB family nuclease